MSNQIKLKRLLWLAFQASSPMGMGFFHASAATAQTEDSLFESVAPHMRNGLINTDYLFGRMMKTTFRVEEGGTLKVSPEVPRTDYQSWGAKYSTAAELIAAAEDSLK